MISLSKDPFSEHIPSDAPFYSVVLDLVQPWQKTQKPYVPVLLGIIRGDGITEVICGANAHKRLGDRTFYCIDFYEYKGLYNDEHTFSHVTTLGIKEVNPFKQALIACFDPLEEAARVRFALEAIKLNKSKVASVWVARCFSDPVTMKSVRYFIELIQYLVFPTDLSHRDLPLAKLFIDKVLEAMPNHPTALDYLADIGELYQTGADGVPQDLHAAERYFLRVVQRDKADAPTRVALGMLYCQGGKNFAPNMREGEKFLQQALWLDPTHVNALNCLGDVYSGGFAGVEVNANRAKGYFERVLRQDPENSFAKKGLAKILDCIGVVEDSSSEGVTSLIRSAVLEDTYGFVEAELQKLAENAIETLLQKAERDDACDMLESLACVN